MAKKTENGVVDESIKKFASTFEYDLQRIAERVESIAQEQQKILERISVRPEVVLSEIEGKVDVNLREMNYQIEQMFICIDSLMKYFNKLEEITKK